MDKVSFRGYHAKGIREENKHIWLLWETMKDDNNSNHRHASNSTKEINIINLTFIIK